MRYKTSMDVEDIEATATVLRNLIFSNFFSTDRYFEVIDKAIHTVQALVGLLASMILGIRISKHVMYRVNFW